MENNNTNLLPAIDKQSEKSVIVYKSDNGTIQLEVQLYEDTVWLNVHQMAHLYGRDEKTIRKHITNPIIEKLSDFCFKNVDVLFCSFFGVFGSDESAYFSDVGNDSLREDYVFINCHSGC